MRIKMADMARLFDEYGMRVEYDTTCGLFRAEGTIRTSQELGMAYLECMVARIPVVKEAVDGQAAVPNQ